MTTQIKHCGGAELLATLLSGLEARESARRSGSPMLVYLADMLVEHAREELETAWPMTPAQVLEPEEPVD